MAWVPGRWADSYLRIVRRLTSAQGGPRPLPSGILIDLSIQSFGHNTHGPKRVGLLCLFRAAGWIKMPRTIRIEVGLVAGHIVFLDGSSHRRKGTQQLPHFRPLSIAPKRSPISTTAKLLFVARSCSMRNDAVDPLPVHVLHIHSRDVNEETRNKARPENTRPRR